MIESLFYFIFQKEREEARRRLEEELAAKRQQFIEKTKQIRIIEAEVEEKPKKKVTFMKK